MTRQWTFGQKLGGGFAVSVVLALAIGVVAVYALRAAVSTKDAIINAQTRQLTDALHLQGFSDREAAESRGFLLTGEARYLDRFNDESASFGHTLARLQQQLGDGALGELLTTIGRRHTEYVAAFERVADLRRSGTSIDTVSQAFDGDLLPRREALDAQLESLVTRVEAERQRATQASTDDATRATTLVVVIAATSVLAAAFMGWLLTRALTRQIGSAVGQVQTSSTQLQAAAVQQATGSRQQAIAMSEISTTISELLATSRQITESAQRVAQIAEQTAAAARAGDAVVHTAHESIDAIKRQVDQIVVHMLELGKKSQQIGAVLDIVSELAEQTNILSINATIEAAGAGESGRRFAVVAEEIRKLADRVGGSTKEIRALIDDVRSAVNTTVMATETGVKAVDAGFRQFTQVAASFKQIADQVITTTEAAREIELSTKQQMTAVEQVNVAISNVTQASKESEASSGETQRTASQLARLSQDLLRLVQTQASAA